jgi:hypothetical protein
MKKDGKPSFFESIGRYGNWAIGSLDLWQPISVHGIRAAKK